MDTFGSTEETKQIVRYRQSKTIEGAVTGEGGQSRKYDRGDVFKEVAEEVAEAQELGKALGVLRDNQISLQEQQLT